MRHLFLLAISLVLSAFGIPDSPLYLYHSASRKDYAAYATEQSLESIKPDYARVGNCTQLPSNSTRVFNTIPLYTYFSGKYNDTANVATPDSISYVESRGYKFVRIEGYIYYKAPTDALSMPLKLYWSEANTDLYMTGCEADEQRARESGYVLRSIEGYAPVVFHDWISAPPPDCPFKQSTTFSGVQMSYRAGIYSHADTWFPTWGSDDNLYMMWGNGSVNGTVANNTYHDTGSAVAIGNDPFNLNITNIHTFKSYPDPYQGRYPSANLVYGGYWYYGTYALDDYKGECGDWCTQGPFIDFRYSPVASPVHPPQWNEPRLFLASDTDNLFHQTSKSDSKVQFGALHVIDFGKEMEYSPDKMVYLIGHGSSNPSSYDSWMQGDSVYLAKGFPDPVQINNGSGWTFLAGKAENGSPFWAPHLDDATPLFSWTNRTGVATMTYLSALKKYIVCVSTPTVSPYTNSDFDTYILESDVLTGPYSLITYMSRFGPEAYFVNIPSKFAQGQIQKDEDGESYVSFYLSYSANYALKDGEKANPPGSGRHWTLMESRFKVNS